MKTKNRQISGYQVRPVDLEGIFFEHRCLDECKRWCRKGYVIVSTYRKKGGFRISLTFGKRYWWWWHYDKYGKSLAWLNIRWEWIYFDLPLEIVYRNE